MIEPGETTVDTYAEVRALRVEINDLRFERDRYRASAADYQEKLIASLDMFDQARSLHDEAEQMRLDLVDLAREFKARETTLRGDAERLRGELVALAAEFGQRLAQDRASAQAAFEQRSVALAAEYGQRLAQDGASAQAAFEQRQGETVAALASAHEDALRHEVVALVKEFRVKLAEKIVASDKSRWWR